MNKLKKALLGIVSALTIGLFAVTGTKVKAETASFTFTAYLDTMQTTAGGETNISNVSNNEISGWYNPASISGVSIPSEYYVSYGSASGGKISKIGNSTSALVANIPSKYKSNITINSANTVGYVCAMSPIEDINQISFSIGNSKGNSGETFVLVTADGSNYYQYGSTEETANLSLTKTITLAQLNETLINAGVDAAENKSMGYAVVLTSNKNIYTTSGSWTTVYDKNVEVTGTFYDVNFYDDAGVKLNNLYQSIEEDGVVDEDLAVAPGVWGKTFSYWATRSGSAGNYTYTKYNFDTTVSDDLDLYAVYTDWSADVISDENVLDYSLMQEGLDAFGANATSTSDRALTGTIYTLAKGGTQFRTANGKINAISTTDAYSAAINTGGNVNNSQNALKFTVENAGSITVYAKNGGGDGNKLGIYDSSCDELTTEDLGSDIIAYTFDVDAGTYFIGGASGSAWIYYASFEEKQLPTATFGTAVGTDNDNNTAIAFIVRLENVEDVTLLDAMAFTVNATFNDKVGNANYAVTTCYEELTAFGDANNFAAVEGTYYVYFTVYGITSNYDGMELNITFNATYDGSAITANTTYTYNA